jgi:hypothetical protein
MKSLQEYAQINYPNHRLTTADGDVELAAYTVVAEVLGSTNVPGVTDELRKAMPDARVAVVRISLTEPTVVAQGGEDPEGVVDLPKRRIAVSAIAAGAVVGLVVGVIVWLTTSFIQGLITAVFSSAVAAVIGAMLGGGARFAGDRAWAQRNAPDKTVNLVAVLTGEEPEALRAVQAIERRGIYDIRIVGVDGAWRSPNRK